jgi:hypothetical protein
MLRHLAARPICPDDVAVRQAIDDVPKFEPGAEFVVRLRRMLGPPRLTARPWRRLPLSI